MRTDDRPIGVIQAELAEVRRHLHEAPPHHGGGAAALRQRLDRLEAELARARSRPTQPPRQDDGA